MKNQQSFGMWIEYLLIIILAIIVLMILYKLFGPFFKSELIKVCIDYGLPCQY